MLSSRNKETEGPIPVSQLNRRLMGEFLDTVAAEPADRVESAYIIW